MSTQAHTLYARTGRWLAMCCLSLCSPALYSAEQLPCFDEFHQIYAVSTEGNRTCWRFKVKPTRAHFEFESLCLMRLAPGCPAAHYVLPMELSVNTGMPVNPRFVTKRGRTTFFRSGQRGQVLKPGSIVAPRQT